MTQFISAISLVVPDYDSAIGFYVEKLGFTLIEDTPMPHGKRWVLVAPPGAAETRLLLARAANAEQTAAIGNQTGGRVFLFLNTDDFDGDYATMKTRGVEFLEAPRDEPYGKVVVFTDPFGNKWDLIEPKA
jgi:catechol 2,3-dioxygenase-like lactoylglutathione lyase family enzyme